MTSGGITQVEAQQLLAGAQRLDNVAGRLDEIRNALHGKLDAEGESWGSDKPGTTHSSGYEPQMTNILESTETHIDNMIEHVKSIEDAARNFVETETGNTRSFQA
ncbi:WXG100 family type VII secretion target [Gordonia sp. CPCC 205515]|uniref:WXG100 family type VII secretion target n=1 Tax=Gordonia sp. CPCC 205515 TaxID=3140791 RepID=UPI003AF3C833